jgi:hypothetical protein
MELSAKAEKILDSVLFLPESFPYPFDTLNNVITCMYSDDKVCRIINWNIPKPDASYIYYGYVQHFDKKENKVTTTKLQDGRGSISNPEKATLKADKWFGALYYEIIPTKIDRKERVYVLLGWEGYSLNANRKIIDVMYFNDGKPLFGKDIFEMSKGVQKRVIFTYNYRAKMKLSWDKNIGMIIFDKLERVPTLPQNMEGNMAPSMLFDALDWDDSVWKFKENVDVKPSAKKRKKRSKPYPY